MDKKVSIVNLTKIKISELILSTQKQAFLLIKNDILGKDYSLSIVFIKKEKSKELNNIYRGKNKPTNILSFPLSKEEGEILICPEIVKTEIKKFDRSFHRLLGFLVIHGILHLKGMKHSSTMERVENIYDQKYFGGY